MIDEGPLARATDDRTMTMSELRRLREHALARRTNPATRRAIANVFDDVIAALAPPHDEAGAVPE